MLLEFFKLRGVEDLYFLASCRSEQKKNTSKKEVQTSLIYFVEEKLSFFIM